VDVIAADADADLNQLGTRIILPSSFTGSTCHMQQLLGCLGYQHGGGDLFITMTANAAWPEIQSALYDIQHTRAGVALRCTTWE
jgi:hypothetical protein